MQSPSEASLAQLRRLGRYLLRYPSIARVFSEQQVPDKIRVYVDSDHAGCSVTQKSTTAIAVKLGIHCAKHASNLQSTIGLSSSESEHYALVKGAAAQLLLQSLLSIGRCI